MADHLAKNADERAYYTVLTILRNMKPKVYYTVAELRAMCVDEPRTYEIRGKFRGSPASEVYVRHQMEGMGGTPSLFTLFCIPLMTRPSMGEYTFMVEDPKFALSLIPSDIPERQSPKSQRRLLAENIQLKCELAELKATIEKLGS